MEGFEQLEREVQERATRLQDGYLEWEKQCNGSKLMMCKADQTTLNDVSNHAFAINGAGYSNGSRETTRAEDQADQATLNDVYNHAFAINGAGYSNGSRETTYAGDQEMDLSTINAVGKMAPFLPKKKLSELDTQLEYPIRSLKFVHTKFGDSVVAEIGNQFSVYLPKRMCKAFRENEQLFKRMVKLSQDGHLYMVYHGGEFNNIEFKQS